TGYGDTYPYSQPLYESSPLDRPSKHYGAGAAWRSADRPVKTEYLLNTVSGVQACKLYNTSGTSTGNYAAGTLHVVKTTDEDNHVAYTFTDKQGRTVLERRVNGSEYLDTYSVYDGFGNLVLVLQPEYQTTASLGQYAFQYEYNSRNLCSKKTLPGAGYISYEYDDADRLIFSQDGNQRTGNKYTYYLYDAFGRVTVQGECTGKSTSSGTVLIRNYYDNYSFVGSGSFASGYSAGNTTYCKGFLTGTEVTVLGSSGKICTVYHYDGKGRVIKSVGNNLLGGMETIMTTYSFTDQPLTVTHTHTATGKTSRTEVYTYTYDHSDRLSTVKHKLGSGSEVTLASYTYDNKGRVATKKQHGSTNTSTYSYNIRSWLTGISSGKFTQTLGYGSHYNGNISSMNWTANGTSHAYTFTYDGVNRMLNATHGTGAYTEKVTLYDKNGNIKALQRYGNGLIDNLTCTYSGNQLTKVEDATGNTAGFNNGASAANEYVYDNNGNLTKDSNKGITNIAYNSLSLPSTVTFSDGSTIVYSYAADGTKLSTVHTISGTTTQKDYCANVVYENGVQKMLLTEEGYVDLSASTPAYYYYLKDNQGNNRVVINSSGTVQETNHYYPFGGVFASTGNVQPYKYNGKELDAKKGLNWYDYGARHYDATLGRWFAVDPLAEKMYSWSPYAYCFNNPMKYVDEEGKLPLFPNLVGGVVGGIVEYGTQVTANMLNNGLSLETFYKGVDFADVGIATLEGFLTSGGSIVKRSVLKTGTAMASELVKSSIDIESDGDIRINKTHEIVNDFILGTVTNNLKTDFKIAPIEQITVNKATKSARKEAHSRGENFTGQDAKTVQKEAVVKNKNVKQVNEIISDATNDFITGSFWQYLFED
ncbi:MAG: RHS repeat-associated core domain-containing protein, partial [Bacteroidaceae bacterium]|nr:RHS repeat-associated core domain-containing protein [Bacteroidaceae bacterium]